MFEGKEGLGMSFRLGQCFLAVVVGLLVGILPAVGLEFPGPRPGEATGAAGEKMRLGNTALECVWRQEEGGLKPVSVTDKLTGKRYEIGDGECFELILADRGVVKCSDLTILTSEMREVGRHRGNTDYDGVELYALLEGLSGNLRVEWTAVLLDGSNYVRQEVKIEALKEDISLGQVVMVDLSAPGAQVTGQVSGAPVAAQNVFWAYEHPLAKSVVEGDRIKCFLERELPLKAGQSLKQSSVVGVAPEGQLRRAYLYYMERERAQAYRQFLHYNSWYDIAWDDRKMQEGECVDVIELFGKEFIGKRGVRMDSFVFDDGWDDNASLWQFHAGFPHGFARLGEAAQEHGSRLGVWLSPWGGYGRAKAERIKYGRGEGFEITEKGFSLAGAKYYERFLEACRGMIEKYKVNFFKFDGTDAQLPAETEALFRLIGELRAAEPDLYVSITTGTWASPYWLWHGDNIWRGGQDMGFYGRGTRREQWITYRDKETYHNVVRRCSLYPLNALMTCGINNGQRGTGSDLPTFGEDFVHEVRSFFGSGTNLQELYITPGRMTERGWDVLAEGVKWSRANAEVLVDTHWVGGDPAKGEIYGWASWSKRKGILVLRNPEEKAGRIALDVGKVFELPSGAVLRYRLKSPWAEDQADEPIMLQAGQEHTFALEPFEVLVFDAQPVP